MSGRKRQRRGNSETRGGSRPSKHHSGRESVRKIVRTAKRGPKQDPYHKNDRYDRMESELQPSEEEEKVRLDSKEIRDSTIPDGAAYNALLTLLLQETANDASDDSLDESDFEVKNHSSDGDEQVSNDHKEELNHESANDEEVAGANLDESDVENDDQENVEALDDELDSDDELAIDADPFEKHFNGRDENYLTTQADLLTTKIKKPWPLTSKGEIDQEYSYMFQSAPGTVTGTGTETVIAPYVSHIGGNVLRSRKVKQRVIKTFEKHYPSLSEHESRLLEPMLQYLDVSFPYRSFLNTWYRKLYVIHAINHIQKTRDRVIKNNQKLHNFRNNTSGGGDEEPEFRDQGFTRPKVLILLPTREAAYEVVMELIKLSGSEQQENKSKLTKQFHTNEVPPEYKPADFQDAFKGNNSDFFCLGVKFTRKSLKLYSSFYTSDLIIASPIGLSMILESPDAKKRQYDFLSSIEVLIVDKANHLEMQNWDHVGTVMKYVNKIPKEFHDADFLRIRMWYINDQSRLLRQTLVFSEYTTPQVNNLISSKSYNVSGKLKFKCHVTTESCIMNSIGMKIKQIFQRFDSPSPVTDPDTRFKFFVNTVLPSLMKTTSYDDGMLIYIPSYFDYLRVKNHLEKHGKITFGSIDEYSSQAQLLRTRNAFAAGKLKVLLYTERLHFFRRFEINGVKNLFMYGIPTNPLFYKDLAKFIGKSVFKEVADVDLSFLKAIYCKWDASLLERVVGSERAGVLCNSPNETFEFR